MMIDLHIHTNHSDGTWSTKRLLEEAEQANLDYISITDHNSVEAYLDVENMDISNIYTGKIITGCEFSCIFNDKKIELLGYGIDIKKTKKWLNDNYNYEEYSFKCEFDKLVELCKRNGIKHTDNLIYDETKEYPYDKIYEDIIKYPENKKIFTDYELASANNFFRIASCNKEHPLHIDFNIDPTAKKVSDFIRSAGGKVFIAHSFVYRLDNTIQVLNELIDNNIIDGIEVYHTDHTEEESNILLELCKKKKLLISAGSDCHGDKRKERKIGRIYNSKTIDNSLIISLLKQLKK
ncbi:MAG: PHP domain-containing protein [Clostridia bacterium]|nr:PHP domain-containing protein [Clostridia bacterium]